MDPPPPEGLLDGRPRPLLEMEVELIRQLGCDKIQGFYFGRPMEAIDAFNLVLFVFRVVVGVTFFLHGYNKVKNGIAGTALAGPAAAVTVTEAFDGAWVDSSAIGQNKGMLVDYIPAANVFFFAFFTYDEAGNQVWMANNFSVEPGTDSYAGLDALAFEGGAFSSAGTPTAARLGSVDLTLQCDRIVAEFLEILEEYVASRYGAETAGAHL